MGEVSSACACMQDKNVQEVTVMMTLAVEVKTYKFLFVEDETKGVHCAYVHANCAFMPTHLHSSEKEILFF